MTPETLAEAMHIKLSRAALWAGHLTEAMAEYGIITPENQAAFLAQIGHESGGLVYVTELWGPTPAQQRYEGRVDLGNTEPGDGFRFRGHGLIQVTGRANHARARDRLREKFPDVPDFEAEPDLLAERVWAALSAADFWDRIGGNDLDFERLTRRINGGLNGYEDRKQRLEWAKQALGA